MRGKEKVEEGWRTGVHVTITGFQAIDSSGFGPVAYRLKGATAKAGD